MNANVRAELPPSVVTWLDARASAQTWRGVAHDVAWCVGRVLLANDGEGGWNAAFRALLATHPSPGVRAVAAELPTGTRRWAARDVARLVCARFELAGAQALARVLSAFNKKRERVGVLT